MHDGRYEVNIAEVTKTPHDKIRVPITVGKEIVSLSLDDISQRCIAIVCPQAGRTSCPREFQLSPTNDPVDNEKRVIRLASSCIQAVETRSHHK